MVFNEMKGALSSADGVLFDALKKALLPDTPYKWNSGGDPAAIVDLSYDYFSSFYKQHYHPSNAMLFFSGDDAPEKRFALVEEYLSGFEASNPADVAPLQSSMEEMRQITDVYGASEGPSGDPKTKSVVTLAWLQSLP